MTWCWISLRQRKTCPCLQVRVPNPDNPAWNALADAWEQIRDVELLPMRDAEECEARRVIDEAAAVALGVSAETVAGWRAMLAAEPTVTNRRGWGRRSVDIVSLDDYAF